MGQRFPIQTVGQEGSQSTVVKVLGIENVAANVEHIAALNLPQLIVAAVFGEGVAHGIGAYHADGILSIKLEGVPDLSGAAHRHQIDGQIPGGNFQAAAPPVGIPLQRSAAAVLHKDIGAAAGGNLAGSGQIHIRSLHNGHIQQNRQILEIRVHLEQDTPVRRGFHIQQMLIEAVFIIVILHGPLVGHHHIVGRDPGAVGEGCVFLQIKGPVSVIGGDLVAGAENRGRVLLAVHGEQALIHQRHQHPVGVIAAEDGIQGSVGVVGQHQILVFLLLFRFRGLLVFSQNGIAGGNVAGIVNAPGAARQQGHEQRQRQKQADRSFHRHTSSQQITAP